MKNPACVIQKPAVGPYTADVLTLEDRPVRELKHGEVLLKVLHISLDPSNLMWLKLLPGWMENVKVGDTMKGPSIALVEESQAENFSKGDVVSGPIDWTKLAVINANLLTKLTIKDNVPLETHLTIFSHVGHAAMIGMNEVAKIKSGETVLVSAAAGATGSLACQIAKARGCTVVGIAGGAEKCQWLLDELKLDAVIDYKNEDVPAKLIEICPDGPDVYFDNVGGEMLDSLLPLLAINARIAVCGQISQYGLTGEPYQFKNLFAFLMRRLTMQGFVVPDFTKDSPRINQMLEDLYIQGALLHRPHILKGLEQAPAGLEMLLKGTNKGKLIVSV